MQEIVMKNRTYKDNLNRYPKGSIKKLSKDSIKFLLIDLGLTYKELGELFGVSPQYVREYSIRVGIIRSMYHTAIEITDRIFDERIKKLEEEIESC